MCLLHSDHSDTHTFRRTSCQPCTVHKSNHCTLTTESDMHLTSWMKNVETVFVVRKNLFQRHFIQRTPIPPRIPTRWTVSNGLASCTVCRRAYFDKNRLSSRVGESRERNNLRNAGAHLFSRERVRLIN